MVKHILNIADNFITLLLYRAYHIFKMVLSKVKNFAKIKEKITKLYVRTTS